VTPFRGKGAALAAALCLLASAAAAEPRLEVPPGAAPEAVLLHARDACDKTDVPDVPARAWRDAENRVHLIASHSTNRRLSGSSLDDLRPDCAIVHEGSRSSAPEHHDDRVWIAAIHTEDGRTIHALGHNEFHGQKRPDLCPAARYRECWANAITALLSADGGRHFTRAEPSAYVAGPPYRYRGDLGRRQGIFQPSNIVAFEGFLYAFVWAEALGAQKRGPCLMRTRDIADPGAWRAHDGRGFSVRFADPYRDPIDDPAAHVCNPVDPGRLFATVHSLNRHRESATWIALTAGSRKSTNGETQTGIWWMTSPDLLRWSAPRLLWAAPLLTHLDCARDTAFYYPSLLDPRSPDRNFGTVGDSAHLYLTRLNLTGCRITWDRDLVRLPVRIAAGP